MNIKANTKQGPGTPREATFSTTRTRKTDDVASPFDEIVKTVGEVAVAAASVAVATAPLPSGRATAPILRQLTQQVETSVRETTGHAGADRRMIRG